MVNSREHMSVVSVNCAQRIADIAFPDAEIPESVDYCDSLQSQLEDVYSDLEQVNGEWIRLVGDNGLHLDQYQDLMMGRAVRITLEKSVNRDRTVGIKDIILPMQSEVTDA